MLVTANITVNIPVLKHNVRGMASDADRGMAII